MAEKKTLTAKVTALTPNFVDGRVTVTVQDGADTVSLYFGSEAASKADMIAAAKQRLTDAIAALDAA